MESMQPTIVWLQMCLSETRAIAPTVQTAELIKIETDDWKVSGHGVTSGEFGVGLHCGFKFIFLICEGDMFNLKQGIKLLFKANRFIKMIKIKHQPD